MVNQPITQWQIGDRIKNRWEIHQILGGGMGVVYIVYDHVSHEALAAKTFQDKFLNDEAARARFRQEALAWVNLDVHRNVTQARFVEDISGKPLLFLEYVSGGDLNQWIGTPRLTQDLPQVLNFAIQFCDGMKYALSKGIQAHRDVKPANCLITQDRILKVTDFGLAKVFSDFLEENENDSSSDKGKLSDRWAKLFGRQQKWRENKQFEQSPQEPNLSRTGRGAGTCTHMAPEQFDDAKHVDVRADIYAFGIMLFQMIRGRLPFIGQSWQDFETLHKRQSPPKLESQDSNLDAIFRICMSKNPSERLSDFGVLRTQLADVYERITSKPALQPLTGKELDAAQWSDKGLSLNNLERSMDALACFDRALALSPQFEQAWNNKSVAFIKLKQYADALSCCERTLEINAESLPAWMNKGLIMRYLGRPNEASAYLDHALMLDPNDPLSLINKGSVLKEQGEFAEAIAYYDRALEFNPRSAEAWTSKGGTLRVMQRPDDALACHNQALRINPHYAEAWSNKGAVLRMLGRYEEAIIAYERALTLNPNLENAWYNKGTALLRLQKYEESLVSFDHALALNPRMDRLQVNKGIALRELGRYEDALECFNQQIELNAAYAEGWFNKGALLVDVFQRYDEALPCFEKAEQLGFQGAIRGVVLCQQMLKHL